MYCWCWLLLLYVISVCKRVTLPPGLHPIAVKYSIHSFILQTSQNQKKKNYKLTAWHNFNNFSYFLAACCLIASSYDKGSVIIFCTQNRQFSLFSSIIFRYLLFFFNTDSLETFFRVRSSLLVMSCKFLGLLSNLENLYQASFVYCLVRFQRISRASLGPFPGSLEGASVKVVALKLKLHQFHGKSVPVQPITSHFSK